MITSQTCAFDAGVGAGPPPLVGAVRASAPNKFRSGRGNILTLTVRTTSDINARGNNQLDACPRKPAASDLFGIDLKKILPVQRRDRHLLVDVRYVLEMLVMPGLSLAARDHE